MKIGRNDLCHCGSGKKYKRCCLSKDEQKRAERLHASAARMDSEDDENDDYDAYLGEEPPVDTNAGDDVLFEEGERDVPDASYAEYAERYKCEPFEENIPQLSVADQKIVDDWWKAFSKVYLKSGDDPVKALAMIRDFLLEHSDLAPNLNLDEAVLFELEDQFNRRGDYAVFIDFLMWLRNNHFRAYRLSGTYYDNFIISYLLLHNRLDEIPQYFSLYLDYPDHAPDNLMDLVELLRVTDNGDLLMTLLKDIYPRIFYSQNVIGGHLFVYPVIVDICGRYFKPSYTEQDLDAVLAELTNIAEQIPQLSLELRRAYWQGLLEDTFNRKYSSVHPTQRADAADYYKKICRHFSGYLSLKKNRTRQFSEYYVSLVEDYLAAQLKNGRSPKKTLAFSRSTVDKYMGRQFKSFIYLKEISCLAFLDAMWCFSEYLHAENVISSEIANDNAAVCRNIYRSIYQSLKAHCHAVRLFENLEARHPQEGTNL